MDILEDMRLQRAVYWPPGFLDENSRKTFDSPIELLVRWEDSSDIFLDRTGTSQVSRAQVFTGEDVEELGVLWLSSKMEEDGDNSSIGELTSETDPFANPKAYEIRKFEKTPTLDADDFLRIAYL